MDEKKMEKEPDASGKRGPSLCPQESRSLRRKEKGVEERPSGSLRGEGDYYQGD